MAQTSSVFTNPMISKLSKVEIPAEERTATYAGITVKTLFFLALTGVGAGACYFNPFPEYSTAFLIGAFILALAMPFLTWAVQPLTCVFGSIYSFCQGYLIGSVSILYAAQYGGIVLAALGLTLVLVLLMLVLYATRIVRVGQKFRAVMMALLFSSLLFSLGIMLLSLVWPYNPIWQIFMGENQLLAIMCAIIGVVIATLFLLSDFDTIERSVVQRLPKQYEWTAAFGLAVTVLWLYVKVLNLLARAKK